MPTSDALASLHHRRALGLLILSALLPGSAQFVAGNRVLGRWVLRVWAAVLGAVVLVVFGLVFARGFTVGLLLQGWIAVTMKVAVWVGFVGWVLLLIDAWRLGQPPKLRRAARLVTTFTALGLAIAMGVMTSGLASAYTVVEIGSGVFQGGGESTRQAGRYNVLLLGADAAEDREGLRPDSINVASIDAETGKSVLFGLPRNLQNIPFPESSPLHDLYPNGYDCPDNECLLNSVYLLGTEHSELFDDSVADPGIQAMKDAVSATLGLTINYYVMVDMSGFTDLIDAMGGIEVTVNKAIPIGGGTSPVSGYIGPGENLHLDGYHALWLARSRHESSDYERMVRQKCVMRAMASQLDPMTVATKFVELSKAGASVVSTDIGSDHVVELAELALKAKDQQIVSVNFIPPMITTANPDYDLIRSRVKTTLDAATASPEPPSSPKQTPSEPTAEPSDEPSPQPTASQTAGDEYGGNSELVDVCSVDL